MGASSEADGLLTLEETDGNGWLAGFHLSTAYYRRGSAELALGHHKKAVKDFKLVVRMKPADKDARSKLKLCEKIIKEAAFAAAIQSERNLPLSETIDVDAIGASVELLRV